MIKNTIDFQDGGLESQVYELIYRMTVLCKSDSFPHFDTKQLEDKSWECILSIPGVKQLVKAKGETEVASINRCASNMLFILNNNYNKNQYDPDITDSVFKKDIEEYFGDIKYNNEYNYHLFGCDILIDPKDHCLIDALNDYAYDNLSQFNEDGEEIDRISEIVTLRYLVKKKKSNLC